MGLRDITQDHISGPFIQPGVLIRLILLNMVQVPDCDIKNGKPVILSCIMNWAYFNNYRLQSPSWAFSIPIPIP